MAASKAAAGLALTDESFHSTVLVLWRNKLRTSAAPERIFDAVRAAITKSGVIAGKTRRALDSTVLDVAVARQDTITMLITQIARVRRLIPELASVWVREHNLEVVALPVIGRTPPTRRASVHLKTAGRPFRRLGASVIGTPMLQITGTDDTVKSTPTEGHQCHSFRLIPAAPFLAPSRS